MSGVLGSMWRADLNSPKLAPHIIRNEKKIIFLNRVCFCFIMPINHHTPGDLGSTLLLIRCNGSGSGGGEIPTL